MWAEWIGTSAIVVIEFLLFTQLLENDKIIFEKFISRIDVIGISNKLVQLELIAQLKKVTKLKLPDSIITAQAMGTNSILLTNDHHFKNIPRLKCLTFEQL